MATEIRRTGLSYDDYAALDDGARYQVVEGELVMTPSPSVRHQRLVMAIGFGLREFVRPRKLGEVFIAPLDVVLRAERPATVLQPDVLFVSRDRGKQVTQLNLQGPPELIVEVLSPSNARLDTVRKSRLYAEYGVDECWFVSHEFDRVEVWRRPTDGTYGFRELYLPGQQLATDLLPGFLLDVAALFAEAGPEPEDEDPPEA